ncbi:hypothetical protein Mapa_000753 [Marchantia paleacea]|nr:hypothetical protein Mapa_000753 [Marchantia paleacea]
MASEMGLKVYGMGMSPAVRIVIFTLYEKDADDFELIRLNLVSGDHKKPAFLEMNPFGKLPAFKDDDLTLFESRAIVRYVAAKFEGQGSPLLGTTLKEKALVDQWIEAESQNFNGPCQTLLAQLIFHKVLMNKEPDEGVVATNVEKLEAVLDVYESRLSKSKYLAGEFFSLADLVHVPYLHFLITGTRLSSIVTSRKHVNAWWEAISSRPTWTRVLSI